MNHITVGEVISRAKVEKCGSGKYPVLSMTMHEGIVFQGDRFKKQIASVNQSAYNIVRRNQLVVSFPIDEGVLAVQDIADAGIVSPAYKIWDINAEVILPKYLELFLRSPRSIQYYKAKLRGSTARRRSITDEDLLGMEMPALSLRDQCNVVNIVARTERTIKLQRKEISALEDLVKARFVEMFGDPMLNTRGWKKEPLRTNATLLNGRAYKQNELLDSGKYPVLRVGNFFSNRTWYYSDLELEEDKYCERGDLLYAWSASFGPQIWKGDKVIYHYHIWKVLVGNAYDKQFLCTLLDNVTASLMRDTHGIAMMHLTKSGMEETEFIVPPLELQKQFVSFVAQVDKSKSVVQKSLEETQLLFDSLMQKYFG